MISYKWNIKVKANKFNCTKLNTQINFQISSYKWNIRKEYLSSGAEYRVCVDEAACSTYILTYF